MKKFFFTALTAVTIVSSAFASPVKNVNNLVKRNFETSFSNALNVEWKVTPEYAKATFIANNVRTEAFYSTDGELIGTSHAIAIDNLPMYAKRSFAKKYEGFTVKESIEFNGNEETAYYISAQKGNKEIVLKIADGAMFECLIPGKK